MTLDSTICPLCGRSNQCALTTQSDISQCWCNTAEVSQQSLDSLPADLRGQACLCPSCASTKPDLPNQEQD